MKSSGVDLGLLSRQRSVVMGVSVAWVMLFHAKFEFPDAVWAAPLRLAKSMGFSGVDVFFLLSGLGLAWSASSGRYKAVAFLLRRAVRLVPSWWAAVILMAVVHALLGAEVSVLGLLERLAGLDFLAGGVFLFWFPPAMLATYLAFVLMWPRLDSSSRPALVAAGLALGAWGVGALLSWAEAAPHLLIWTTRLPSFLLGVWIGRHLAHGGSNLPAAPAWFWASAVVGVALWLGFRHGLPESESWRWGTIWSPFFLVALPVGLGVAWLAERAAGSTTGRVRAALTWMGENSLELYLVHLVAVETLWSRLDSLVVLPGVADTCCLLAALLLAPQLRRILADRSRSPSRS